TRAEIYGAGARPQRWRGRLGPWWRVHPFPPRPFRPPAPFAEKRMKRITVPERGAETLFGTQDETLRFLEDNLKVRIKSAGSELLVEGEEQGEETVAQIFGQLGSLMEDGYSVSAGGVRLGAQLLAEEEGVRLRDYVMKSAVRGGKKVVVPRSLNQRAYLEQIQTHDMV